jgi:lysyl-tRNA synthetase class 2
LGPEAGVAVMTMGALHQGHLDLVRAARARGGQVIVTIFVNPLQFGPGEDFARYPRDLESDLAALAAVGADLVYAPDELDIYPSGPPATTVDPGPLGERFEGAIRPGHFRGVLTVVAKLLARTRARAAVFGEKDAQQLAAIRQMVRDLDLDLELVAVPTRRDADGLALSSRNAYLSPAQRARALALPRSITAGRDAAAVGAPPSQIRRAARAAFGREPRLPDYLDLVDPASFEPVPETWSGPARLIGSLDAGPARLIDNAEVTVAAQPFGSLLRVRQPNPSPDPEPPTISEQSLVRRAKRAAILERGDQAYAVEAPLTTTIAAVRDEFGGLEAGAETDRVVGLAGRVVFIRNTGKLCFASLRDGAGRQLQAMLSLREVGAESLDAFKAEVDLGDHLFVHGRVIASKRGELSVLADRWQIVSKALRPLPVLHSDLSDESRVRDRAADLIVRPAAREAARARVKAIRAVRRTLEDLGFLEIETPILQTLHGGAAARPFQTHMNAFDQDLYLRIAPELFLKRAVAGGLERVFEIGRVFRNEGVDSSHAPEFTSLEVYQAYADYLTMADLTEQIVRAAALAVAGSLTVTLHDGARYDFGGEWPRLTLYGSLSQRLGEDITPATPVERLRAIARARGIQHPPGAGHGKLVEELFEELVGRHLFEPTFVLDFPVETSPLTRDHRSQPGLVEKWDLYVRGVELATAYSELIDPVIQRQRFAAQAAAGAAGDAEAMSLDEDFLAAMEYGLPPLGGMGLGIDRLLMATTGLGIRETILFPLVKPQG